MMKYFDDVLPHTAPFKPFKTLILLSNKIPICKSSDASVLVTKLNYEYGINLFNT